MEFENGLDICSPPGRGGWGVGVVVAGCEIPSGVFGGVFGGTKGGLHARCLPGLSEPVSVRARAITRALS